MTCTNCARKVTTGQKYVAQALPTDGLTLAMKYDKNNNLIRPNYRFYHLDCIKKVPGLNRLEVKEYTEYNSAQQDRKEIKL